MTSYRRRTGFRFVWFCLLLTLSAAVLFSPSFLSAKEKNNTAKKPTPAGPNVVVILADDLGYGDLACYGHPKFRTPNLDRLAGQGVRFTQFQTNCPFCAPTRAGLMTGRYQFRSGMTNNPTPDAGINDLGLPDSERTLGEMFRDAGYATSCIGKWHLGHKPEFHPLRHGFEEYLGILYSNDMRPVELWDNDKVIEYPVVQANLTRRYTERALNFIERNKEKPFFLYLPHAMPHKPLAASEAFYKKSGNGLYGDVIEELDWSIGQIMKRLDDLGLAENTLIFFTSDNGPWYGGSSGGLRGMKGQGWEGGIRVPMIARWPGKIPAGEVRHQPTIVLDLYVTALAAAGISLPENQVIDGKNILPVLQSDAPSPHEVLFSMRGDVILTVRSGKWKLHVATPGPKGQKPVSSGEEWIDPRGPDGVTILAPYEQAHPSQFPGVLGGDDFDGRALFNLEEDPSEQHNLAAKHPEIVEKLEKHYQVLQAQLPASTPSKKGKKK